MAARTQAARKQAKKVRANKRVVKKANSAKRRPRRPNKPRSTFGKQLHRYRRWFLPSDGIFADLRLHGNTSWRFPALVWLALCWAWADSKNVTDACAAAVLQCQGMKVESLSTYTGMMNALVRWTDRLMPLLWSVLHQRMREIAGKDWEIAGWVAFGMDGTRDAAPRTKSNEQAFCAPDYGQGMTAKYRKKKTKGLRRTKNEKNPAQPPEPQVWITLIWHMGLGLPWMWRLGPSNSSEREHVGKMLDDGEFPQNSLQCGDAGFVGYPIWRHILSKGHHFLVRVGANVNLLTEQAEWSALSEGEVLCWPQAVVKAGGEPLRLRRVRVKVGKTDMWMLTSVLEPSRLTKRQIVTLYKRRWGIEVAFRGLKQTLDRAKLRCETQERVLVELHWSLMAMAVAELFALKEQLAPLPTPRKLTDPTPDPRRRSLAQTMRALRFALNHLKDAPQPGHDLQNRLRQALTDDYVRKSSKRARYRPKNPDKKPLGNPEVRPLTHKEQQKLETLKHAKHAA